MCFACVFSEIESRDPNFYTDTIPMREPQSERLGPITSLFQCLQYEWAREFPDYKESSANNLSIDLFISNSHFPSMYTLSMVRAEIKINIEK